MRLTKKYEDGSYGFADKLPHGENSHEMKDLMIQTLGEYEDKAHLIRIRGQQVLLRRILMERMVKGAENYERLSLLYQRTDAEISLLNYLIDDKANRGLGTELTALGLEEEFFGRLYEDKLI